MVISEGKPVTWFFRYMRYLKRKEFDNHVGITPWYFQSYPASCASCALTIDSRLFFCRNSQQAE